MAAATETFRRAWLTEASNRLHGNINAMAAAYPDHDIIMRVDETIDEFTRGSSLHFAHLVVAPSDPVGREAGTPPLDDNAKTSTDVAPVLRYQLLDYAWTKKLDVPNGTIIKPPAGVWSVTFDM